MSDDEIRIAIAEACGWSEILRPVEGKYHDLPIELVAVCNSKNRPLSARARQRAEAFLRTIGEWKEEA